MRFRNPKVPDDINVSRHNHFADLLLLSGGLIVGFVILAAGLIWLGGTLARHLPVALENDFADLFAESMADLPESAFAPRRYQPGEVMEGEVVRVDEEPPGISP